MNSDDSNVDHSLILGFDVFAIIIILYSMLVMLTAALSRQVQRRASWFNFMLPVMLYAATFLLSLGSQGSPEAIRHAYVSCIMQAVLIYALPVYCAIGFGCVVLDFYLLLRRLLEKRSESRIVSILILAIPPGSFLSILTADLILFLVDPTVHQSLEPDSSKIYCHSKLANPITYITALVGVPGFLLWFIVYVKIVLLLKKNKPAIMQYDKPTRRSILSVFIRTTLMTFIIAISAVLAIFFVLGPSVGPSFVVVWLVFPLLGLLMFGTQPDLFRCWMCRRRRNLEAPQDPDMVGLSSL